MTDQIFLFSHSFLTLMHKTNTNVWLTSCFLLENCRHLLLISWNQLLMDGNERSFTWMKNLSRDLVLPFFFLASCTTFLMTLCKLWMSSKPTQVVWRRDHINRQRWSIFSIKTWITATLTSLSSHLSLLQISKCWTVPLNVLQTGVIIQPYFILVLLVCSNASDD